MKSRRQPHSAGLYVGRVFPPSLALQPLSALVFAMARNKTRPLDDTQRGKLWALSRLGWSGKIALAK